MSSANGTHYQVASDKPKSDLLQNGSDEPKHPRPQCIGIVGFGNFGQFLGRRFVHQGHRVIGVSRGDYFKVAEEMGAEYVQNYDDLMDREPGIVILCTSIMSLEGVLSRFPIQQLSNCLVVDVLSVKMYPRKLLLNMLPEGSDILCTHPMFGPESGRHSWKSLPFVYEQVRISENTRRRCDDFLKIFSLEQCEMVNMTCEQHDSHAASTQFITHTMGRMLAELDVQSTPINTKGYKSLLGVVETTCKDSFDLFYGLYKYNPHSRGQLDKLEDSLKALRKQLCEKEEAEQKSKSESSK